MTPAYLLVLLERGAVPFCLYENPYYFSSAKPDWIEPALLDAIVRHAEDTGTALMVVHGRHRPPRKLRTILERVVHAQIVPFTGHGDRDGAIVVLESEEREHFTDLSEDWTRSLILRVERRDLAVCSDMFEALIGRFGRLVLHPRGIEYFDADDLQVYAGELDRIGQKIRRLYEAGRQVEVNVLTDRIMLSEMRNCDAGVSHFTIAPDGGCYVCPGDIAFENGPIGRFSPDQGLALQPPAHLDLSHAPLCMRCDAFHCKRCVHLNGRLTGEVNVPSRQQCLVAHVEREASRRLVESLATMEPFRRVRRIPELDYTDPLDAMPGGLIGT